MNTLRFAERQAFFARSWFAYRQDRGRLWMPLLCGRQRHGGPSSGKTVALVGAIHTMRSTRGRSFKSRRTVLQSSDNYRFINYGPVSMIVGDGAQNLFGFSR